MAPITTKTKIMKLNQILAVMLTLGVSVNVGQLKAQDKLSGCDLCGPTSGNTVNSANGAYSATIGFGNTTSGTASLAVGKYAKTSAGTSFALGSFVRASATNAFVIGSGINETTSNMLTNTASNTLMIGFNSKKPTVFIGASLGGETTGKVGIGNVTVPKAKLHIESDSGEDAGIILKPKDKNENRSFLELYDESNVISVSKNDGMVLQGDNITLNGKIGINMKNDLTGMDYGIAVSGGVLTDEVFVREVSEWHDDVFKDNYDLMSLSDLDKYIKDNGHLPEMPSEEDVLSHGYSMVEIQSLLVKKIEELTLYVIELRAELENNK